MDEWLSEKTSFEASSAVRHFVNRETGKLIRHRALYLFPDQRMTDDDTVSISSQTARDFLNAQHWRERFDQRLGISKLYSDGSTIGMLSNIVAMELAQVYKVSSLT